MRADIESVVAESTCQKRVTVCVIFGADGEVLACESNRCAPNGGRCERLGVVNGLEGYPLVSCNWAHAEARAVGALPAGSRPVRAELWGHDFACEPCREALRSVGINDIEVYPSGNGTGLRCV